MFEGEFKSCPPLHCSLCDDTPGTSWWHHLPSALALINKLWRPVPKRDRPFFFTPAFYLVERFIHWKNLSCLTSSRFISISKLLFHCQAEYKDVSQWRRAGLWICQTQQELSDLNVTNTWSVSRVNSPPVSDCHWPGLPPRTRSPRQLQHKQRERERFMRNWIQ